MPQFMHHRMTRRAASRLMCAFLLALAPPLHAQQSVLGQHTINLQLKPSPVGDVLKLLSGRSKAVAKLPDGARPSDEGRAWEVDGADKLDGIIVAVSFVETPVEQVVAQLLGCVGFSYTERGDSIAIERSGHTLPPEKCTGVERLRGPVEEGALSPSTSAANYSFRSESISALKFIRDLSSVTGQNISVLHNDAELLKNMNLRVEVADMQRDEVLTSMFKCIGWKLEKTSVGYVASRPDVPMQSVCEQFSVL